MLGWEVYTIVLISRMRTMTRWSGIRAFYLKILDSDRLSRLSDLHMRMQRTPLLTPLMKNGIACTLVDHAREASCGGSRVQRLRMVLRGSVTQEHDFCRRIMEGGEGEKRPHGRTGDG